MALRIGVVERPDEGGAAQCHVDAQTLEAALRGCGHVVSTLTLAALADALHARALDVLVWPSLWLAPAEAALHAAALAARVRCVALESAPSLLAQLDAWAGPVANDRGGGAAFAAPALAALWIAAHIAPTHATPLRVLSRASPQTVPLTWRPPSADAGLLRRPPRGAALQRGAHVIVSARNVRVDDSAWLLCVAAQAFEQAHPGAIAGLHVLSAPWADGAPTPAAQAMADGLRGLAGRVHLHRGGAAAELPAFAEAPHAVVVGAHCPLGLPSPRLFELAWMGFTTWHNAAAAAALGHAYSGDELADAVAALGRALAEEATADPLARCANARAWLSALHPDCPAVREGFARALEKVAGGIM